MRSWIDIVAREALMEKVFTLPLRLYRLSGPYVVDITVLENPNKRQVMTFCQKNPALAGDANIRGFAHAGKVWVWSGTEDGATHTSVLVAMGYEKPGEYVAYNSPEFCMFQLLGYGFQEGDPDKARNVLRYLSPAALPVLLATSAKRWGCTLEHARDWY